MYPILIMNKPHFYIEKRINVFAKNGHEWVLNVQLNQEIWTLTSWNKKPSTEDVQMAVNLVMRSFEVYHKQLVHFIPAFNPEHTVKQGHTGTD